MPKLADSLKESLALRTKTYNAQLAGESPTGQAGRDYLSSRLIIREHWIKYWLGVVAEPLSGDEEYAGRLVIPYMTLAGVRGLKYRCMEDHDCKASGHTKYTQPRGQDQRLYNAPAYFGVHDTIGVCEGELDAITASEYLRVPTLGIPGASQWNKQGKFWQLVLKDFGTVIVFADGDVPGKQLASQIANDAGPGSRVVHCDDGTDINSMIVAGKSDILLKKAGL